MKSASVARLKASLSEYLRTVKRGGEVQITERGVPIARLVRIEPVAASDENVLQRLVRAGVVASATAEVTPFLNQPPVDVGDADILGALLDDRQDRF